MQRRIGVIALWWMAACASGAGVGTDRLDAGRRDVPTIDAPGMDTPGFDASGMDVGRSDTGGTCTDDAHADECNLATPIVVMTGDEPTVIDGFLPTLSGADWFSIEFPAMSGPNMQGMGTPTILLSGDDTMVIEVRDGCDSTLPVTCGEGSAREAISYSFIDDQSMPGEADGDGSDTYTTRDTPWPETLVVRVGRRGGPAGCEPYSLTISR